MKLTTSQKAKILTACSTIITLVGMYISAKAEEAEKEELKAELKEDILKSLFDKSEEE